MQLGSVVAGGGRRRPTHHEISAGVHAAVTADCAEYAVGDLKQ